MDEDIPDLRIGVVSYGFARIAITGPDAGHVVAVHYAGFNGDNDHCGAGAPLTTSILGVPASAASLSIIPPAKLADPFGYPFIICSYSCVEGEALGGCNSAQQVAARFQALWGLAPRFHRTKHACWDVEFFVSEGGHCCSGALSTGAVEAELHGTGSRPGIDARLEGDRLLVHDTRALRLLDAAGRVLWRHRGPPRKAAMRRTCARWVRVCRSWWRTMVRCTASSACRDGSRLRDQRFSVPTWNPSPPHTVTSLSGMDPPKPPG